MMFACGWKVLVMRVGQSVHENYYAWVQEIMVTPRFLCSPRHSLHKVSVASNADNFSVDHNKEQLTYRSSSMFVEVKPPTLMTYELNDKRSFLSGSWFVKCPTDCVQNIFVRRS